MVDSILLCRGWAAVVGSNGTFSCDRFATLMIKSAFHTAVGSPVQYPYRMSPKAFRESSGPRGGAKGPRSADRRLAPATRPRRSVDGLSDPAMQRRGSSHAPLRLWHVAAWIVLSALCAVLTAALATRAGLGRPSIAQSAPSTPSVPSTGNRGRAPIATTPGRSGRAAVPSSSTESVVPALRPIDPTAAAGAAPTASQATALAGAQGAAATAAGSVPHPSEPGTHAAQVLSNVGFVADSHGPQVRACYERAFRHDPNPPSGRIELSFSLVDAGDVGRAVEIRPELNLLGNAIVASCLIELVGEWRFPRPPGGQTQVVRYPFLFSAVP